MQTIMLNGRWNLYAFPTELQKKPISDVLTLTPMPAAVPGNVEFALQDAGLLPKDIFMGNNVLKTQDFEAYDFVYERTFTLRDADLVKSWRLVFEGVDCIADYYLNDELIAHTENALIGHVIPCNNLRSTNTLRIYLRSAMAAAMEETYPAVGYFINIEQLRLRKPASAFGWDIMPRTVSAGLWRGVRLEEICESEIEDLYFVTKKLHDDRADMQFYFRIRTIPANLYKMRLHIEGKCGESSFCVDQKLFFNTGVIAFTINNPKLWWPRGYGDANLYDTKVTLYVDDEAADEKTMRVGVRTIELDRHVKVDAWGTPNGFPEFCFFVNGEKIFSKGSNWVPLDAFHSRDYADGRLERAVEMLRDLNCNIVRCWGGNVYEDHAFFDLCDESGIMVWQDFAMACGFYPEDDKFLAQMKEECLFIIRKLRGHASLAIWCGDNECDHGDMEPSANVITRGLIPSLLRSEDPARAYIPSSPDLTLRKPGVQDVDGLSPEQHTWGPRDHFKADFYTRHNARFVSEAGYHGCCSAESIRKFITPDHVWPWQDNHEWLTHASDAGRGTFVYRIALMAKQIRQTFGFTPASLEDFVFASQFTQAEAKKFFIEKMRMGKWERTGIIWWNLLDGWPQFSDAIVDYFFDKKLAYNHIKRAQQDVVLCMSEIEGWESALVVANDTFTPRTGTYTVTDGETGEVLAEGPFMVGANESRKVGSLPVFYSEKRLVLLKLDYDGKTVWNHHIFGEVPFDLACAKVWQGIIDRLPWQSP